MPMLMTDEIPILNEAAKVKRNLNQDNHDRWGFAIYRCTYGDDGAWDRFKDIISTRAQKEILELDEPEILDKLEWTIFDNRDIFDHATTDFLCKHFNQWRSAKWQHEQPRATRPTEAMLLKTPRYRYFIGVDREAFDSVLSAPAHWIQGPRPPVGFISLTLCGQPRWMMLTRTPKNSICPAWISSLLKVVGRKMWAG
ncbi:hypothetical protein NU219Hw_g6838t1 [Hortaea werneckii]